ncbi:MAG: hypothetical protein WEB60_04415 [Terrimicrobiaceae bacterium]
MDIDFLLCETRALRIRFERFPECLHAAQQHYVPPFPMSVAKILSSDSSFNKRHGTIFPFLALRHGKPVGRIAAIINKTHNACHKDRVGFFGFFECENDPRLAKMLFGKVEEILRAKGLDTLRGPYNPSINDECGLLVDGFDSPPCVGLTWNPAYYVPLVLGAGFQKRMASFGYNLPLHRLPPPPRLKPLAERVAKRSKARLRPINLRSLERDLEIIREVYNATLERNWGFVPIEKEDLDSAADEFRAIAYPEMMLIAEQDGVNAGVALTIPNINIHLARLRKTPWLLRPLHFLYLLKTQKLRKGRQIVYGIAPRFRNNGLHAWLTYEQFMCAQRCVDDAELGWIQEENTEVMELSELIGGYKLHQWDLYEKAISPKDSEA